MLKGLLSPYPTILFFFYLPYTRPSHQIFIVFPPPFSPYAQIISPHVFSFWKVPRHFCLSTNLLISLSILSDHRAHPLISATQPRVFSPQLWHPTFLLQITLSPQSHHLTDPLSFRTQRPALANSSPAALNILYQSHPISDSISRILTFSLASEAPHRFTLTHIYS